MESFKLATSGRLTAIGMCAAVLLVCLLGASQPSHVRRLSRALYYPVIEQPTLAAEPLTWQERWLVERSITIQIRHGFPIDLPE